MRTGLVVVILALIALAFFNPDMEDFERFVETHSGTLIQKETGDTEIGRILSRLGSSLAAEFVADVTERHNYGIFSTYTIDLDGPSTDDSEWRFIGIAGQFVQTKRPGEGEVRP